MREFQKSAFRFEIRDRYNSEVGREPFRRFQAGELDDFAWHRSWMDMLRRDHESGKAWQRVRIVSVPLSDWSRYALTVARLSIQAGDDIRYLSRERAAELGLDPFDAWLLDDECLVTLHFADADDTFVGAELVTDTTTVRQHQQWRGIAWRSAQTLEDFVAATA